MRSEAPPLMPVFRSHRQAQVLAAVLLHPDDEVSLTGLAERLGVAASSIFPYVRQLARAGIFTERAVGRTRLYRANPAHPAVGPLTQLVAVTYGAVPVVAEEFEAVPGVDEVWVYGSWAARYRGEPGAFPNDIDVLVVGTPERADVYDAADRVEQRVGNRVNPVRGGDRPGERARAGVRRRAVRPCTALLVHQGLRPTTKGGHYVVERAVRAQFGDAFKPFGALRRRRNELEYPVFADALIAADEVEAAVTAAAALTEAAARLLPELGAF
jgi:predicted nucleotidyltransferase